MNKKRYVCGCSSVVEYFLAKEAVVGSNPITRSFIGYCMKIFDSIKENIKNVGYGKILNFLITVAISAIVACVVSAQKVKSSGKKMITDNPQAIIEAVEKYYKDEQRRAKEASSKKAPEVAKQLEKINPSLGNKNGQKVIVEFFDYACGHCKRQAVELTKVMKADSDVKVVLADLAIMSQHSLTAAQTGVYIALNKPDKLERYYTELSQKQVNQETIKQVLKTIGLPENYIKLAGKDKAVEEVLQRNFQLAREIGLQGTPALIINGKFIGGMITADDIASMLK